MTIKEVEVIYGRDKKECELTLKIEKRKFIKTAFTISAVACLVDIGLLIWASQIPPIISEYGPNSEYSIVFEMNIV